MIRIPSQTLDEFALKLIRELLLGDAKTTNQAIKAFVKAMSKPKAAVNESDSKREIEQLNRRIKTTVGLLADPHFEGIDDIHLVLTDLKRKRDALIGKQRKQTVADIPTLTQQQLRDWANEQFVKLDAIATRTAHTLADRQLVQAFIQQVEVDPEAKTAIFYIYQDLQVVLASTRVVGVERDQSHENRSDTNHLPLPIIAMNWPQNRESVYYAQSKALRLVRISDDSVLHSSSARQKGNTNGH